MHCSFQDFSDAVKKGDVNELETLNYLASYIDQADSNGYTSLHWAAHAHYDMAKFLLAKGAKINVKNNGLNSPLSLAAYYGQKDIVSLFLEHKANIELGGDYGGTPLCNAVRGGYEDTVKLLLDKRASIDGHDCSGNKPLHLAAFNCNFNRGYPGIAALLRSRDASLDSKNNDG